MFMPCCFLRMFIVMRLLLRISKCRRIAER